MSYAARRILAWLAGLSLARTWWLADRLSLSLAWLPGGRHWWLSENGGRDAAEVLDVYLQAGRLHVNVSLWGLGWLAPLTRRIPRGPDDAGHTLGVAPDDWPDVSPLDTT